MTFVTKRNTHITLCVIGGCYVLGYGFLGIDFGHGSIPSHEAWDRGVAQPYVLAGFILVALSTIYYRGGTWARWPILLWYPLTVTSGAFWADWLDVAKFDALQSAIQIEQRNVAKLHQQKLGLMHDLLTGKVPVKPDESEEVAADA